MEKYATPEIEKIIAKAIEDGIESEENYAEVAHRVAEALDQRPS